MGQKLVIGPIDKGIRSDRTAFNIDNDSFPKLINAYQWRGRIKRKRGTSPLNRLVRNFPITTTGGAPSSSVGNTTAVPWSFNLYTSYTPALTFNTAETYKQIVPKSVMITIGSAPGYIIYDDGNGNMTSLTAGNTGTINYTNGNIIMTALTAAPGTPTTLVKFQYYPTLPVMGLETLVIPNSQFPGNIAFDTVYSYNISTDSSTNPPFNIFDVSFYKNPSPVSPYNYPGYIQKTEWTPLTWNGGDYQQFYSVNYQGALWVTNGVDGSFNLNTIGMQYAPSNTITVVSQTATTIVLTITSCPLVVGDFVFLNEFTSATPANAQTLNFQSGYVTIATGSFASLTVTITFPYAAIATDTYTPGIVQYLTNRSDATKDCIRWYDGNPTNGTSVPFPSASSSGWVNFSPPIQFNIISLDDSPARTYYLVGSRMIFPFKDRLLFIGPVLQTSGGFKIYLQDTVVFSQNGTPYYTCSFNGANNAVLSPKTTFTPILTPVNQVATANSYFGDTPGFGGFIAAGIDQPITTVSPNEDVLIMGFTNAQTRFVDVGNDVIPFAFFLINSELGSSSTFSTITLDRGAITIGPHGIQLTSQTAAQRIDLDIPDEVFEINLSNNGGFRVTAQRDFTQEWIYFTYPGDQISYNFPNTTLQYNYRDNSWAIFYESYTTYGQFRPSTGWTWNNIGFKYPTWNSWNTPWNSSTSNILQPQVIAGNTNGFVVIRDSGTNEAQSLSIYSFAVGGPPLPVTATVVTCPNHCLNSGDFIVINNCTGTIGTLVNGKIYIVTPIDANTFSIALSYTGLTYFGGGTIKRMYIPIIQTKQFPLAWDSGRKTRIGVQQYLLTTTSNAEITLLIYLSQNASSAYNIGPVVPANNSTNNSLIYTTELSTSPDLPINVIPTTPLGYLGNGILTTLNLGLPTNLLPNSIEITIGNVASFSDNGIGGLIAAGTGVTSGSSVNYLTGSVVMVFSVAPDQEKSTAEYSYYGQNIQNPTASQQLQTWHRINTSLIGDTVQFAFTMSYEQMGDPTFSNQFSEIELHSIVLDTTPSSILA